jgi:hypothetical protein
LKYYTGFPLNDCGIVLKGFGQLSKAFGASSQLFTFAGLSNGPEISGSEAIAPGLDITSTLFGTRSERSYDDAYPMG